VIEGRVLKLGHNIPGVHGVVTPEADELFLAGQTEKAVTQLFVPIGLDRRVAEGKDRIVVAGAEFCHGHGHYFWSSIALLKASGIVAVFAMSFPYAFKRMAINNGLVALPAAQIYEHVDDGDDIAFDLSTGQFTNRSKGGAFDLGATPSVIRSILEVGGLGAYAQIRLGI
jgi:3-isopropylmalate dehydratase small subunit